MIGRGLNFRFQTLYRETTMFKCSKESQQIFHPLGYNDMLTAFLIVFGGGISAVSLFILERLLIHLKKYKRKKRTTPDGAIALENGVMINYSTWVK